jgi:hypothetical protein
MPDTYTLIASSTVGSGGAANITFSSIPQTYTDLLIKVSARSLYNGAGGGSSIRDNLGFYFNGASGGTTWSAKVLYGIPGIVTGSGGGTGGANGTAGYSNGTGNTANTFGTNEIYIPNYTGSAQKSSSADGASESNDTSTGLQISANLTSSTSAVTSITLLSSSGAGAFDLVQNSTAYLYGIVKS